MVAIDLHTALPEGVLLVLIDYLTGFILLRAIADKTAPSVAGALFDAFCNFGFPNTLHSDEGRDFINTILDALLRQAGTVHRISPSYAPSRNGRVERAIGTVVASVKKMLGTRLSSWTRKLPLVQLAY